MTAPTVFLGKAKGNCAFAFTLGHFVRSRSDRIKQRRLHFRKHLALYSRLLFLRKILRRSQKRIRPGDGSRHNQRSERSCTQRSYSMIRRLSSFLFSTGLAASLYVDDGLASADIDRRATADAPGRSATAGMAASAVKIGTHILSMWCLSCFARPGTVVIATTKVTWTVCHTCISSITLIRDT